MNKNKRKLIKLENDSYNDRRNAIPRYGVILDPKIIEDKETGFMFFEALDEFARIINITARPTKKKIIKNNLKRGSVITYYKNYGFNYFLEIKEGLEKVEADEYSIEVLGDMLKFENCNLPEFIVKNENKIRANLSRLKDKNRELYVRVFLSDYILLK